MQHGSTVRAVAAPVLSAHQLARLAKVRWENRELNFQQGAEVAHFTGRRGLGRITGQRHTTLFSGNRLEYEVTFADPTWPDGWKVYAPGRELITAEQWRGIVG